jgi:phosphoglucomutase
MALGMIGGPQEKVSRTMSTTISPLAGKPAPKSLLVDLTKLVDDYYALRPDVREPAQRVSFGTSGHRGTSFERSFNEAHILAITQAICEYRAGQGITGPLFIGADTHALSAPAQDSALQVLAAHGVDTRRAAHGEFTPTPTISHAILTYNEGRESALADGIVVTPSHNPPDNGGFKYNPPNGGPADTEVTGWIQSRANALIEAGLREVRRTGPGGSASVHEHDYVSAYVADLGHVVDFAAIRAAGVAIGIDPLGGAGVHYWGRIGERYGLNLTVVNETVDPQFAFMSVDWDGKIRMDPSSSYAMQRLIALKDRYDVAAACDTDHDRHGIVAPSVGLLPANHYLAVMVAYLFAARAGWPAAAGVGKTVVSTALIDRIAKKLGRRLLEVPVGFKWFVRGLMQGELGFGGEESAGATVLRLDGRVWTTDKDGIVPALLAAEMTARDGHDPGESYRRLTAELGECFAERQEGAATPEQKSRLAQLTPKEVKSGEMAGEKILQVLDRAPGNNAPIGGIKAVSQSGWFAARPSGTESLYKVYAESFKSAAHLKALLSDATAIVDQAIKGA